VIARAGKPIARVTPIVATADSRSGVRFGGIKPAKLRLTVDFHAPLTDENLLNP
jgi:antitoxin (DNA-binding transcriptional repressor) of toxin-antitoxin stability system